MPPDRINKVAAAHEQRAGFIWHFNVYVHSNNRIFQVYKTMASRITYKLEPPGEYCTIFRGHSLRSENKIFNKNK